MKKILVAMLSAIFSLSAGQTPKEKIIGAISNYYNLDRENIHVHFDKTVFFTNESIWFKGYVFNKKNNTPFFETTNVFAILFDSDGKKVKEQLLFSYNGTFTGDFKLDKSLLSGRYHILFFTNWMNNFKENESSVYAVDIINENSSEFLDYGEPNFSKINIEFHPEGGNFVYGVVNNLGIKISDCNGNPVPAQEVVIVDGNGEIVKNFPINKSGYAKINLKATDENYKAVVTVNGVRTEAKLPAPTKQGMAIEVNNYALPNKTVIRIKSNAATANSLPDNAAYVVIQQNEKANVIDIDFNDKQYEKELAIAGDNFFSGSNTIRIIDKNLNQWAERTIFEFPQYKSGLSVRVLKKTTDTITLSGQIAYPNANISISVMPENAISDVKLSDIYGEFLLNPYIQQKVVNAEYYLNNATKAKRYELDLFLLNQSSKSDWRDIVSITPKIAYDFDIGLTIKGTINNALPDPKKHRIQALAPVWFLNDYSAINDKKEFEFKNLVLADSVTINMTLMKIPSIPVHANFFQNVVNRKRSFLKTINFEHPSCAPPTKKILLDDLPQFSASTIMLKEIELTGKSKSELAYRNRFGNASLRGYKITPADYNTSLLNFIGSNGFYVSNNFGNISITGRLRTTINGASSTPEIFINGRKLMTFDELSELQMDQIDEIYFNPHAIVASMNNNMGIIKIYLKKLDYFNARGETKRFTIPEGFARINSFENPPIISTAGKGFENYGVIQWVPSIITGETGGFTFRVPKTDIKTAKIRIQGFAPDGTLISETMTLPLE